MTADARKLADEIDDYVKPLAPHIANRRAAELLRRASAVLRVQPGYVPLRPSEEALPKGENDVG